MYNFHCNFIKSNFDGELLLTDTDSLTKKHKLGTYEFYKISLSCFDDKRCVLDDRTRALAFFHKDSVTTCKEIKNDCDD